jgi:hypothetical protein
MLLSCYEELVAVPSEECSGNFPSPETLFPSLGHVLNEGEEGTGMPRSKMSVRFEILRGHNGEMSCHGERVGG